MVGLGQLLADVAVAEQYLLQTALQPEAAFLPSSGPQEVMKLAIRLLGMNVGEDLLQQIFQIAGQRRDVF